MHPTNFTLRILATPQDKKFTGTAGLVLHYICLAEDSVQKVGWTLLITLVIHIHSTPRRQGDRFNGIEVSVHTYNLFINLKKIIQFLEITFHL